ncbi:hypothetical protein D9M72_454240 [compost metagenome]
MDIDRSAARQVVAELADRFHERHRFDVADGTADLTQHEIIVVVAFGNEVLDLVGDVRDHLNGCAEVVAATFLIDDVLVDPASGDVVGLRRRTPREAFIVAEIEIGLRTIIGYENLTVLGRAHGARINVEVGVELAQSHPVATRLQQCSESRCSDAFSEGGNHAACDEYISRHGSHRIPFNK